ncbi:MAG: DUF2029 domain-containing protein [Chloroflexi bacterium]|jgi:hypothetical protein|nr:DUF2029 domain-containing protein [Chloroflexota bacterium]MBT3670792.1 DUF2029 domain-containing protein [Chloroflexota bacterium]MBT4002083.1 DUF2029 domain-containing protein [Chloroflexota bacterium]MBT4305601.1 DUF2029 domain-containing protein [Chloroflexota bacterium]MBT4533318.1 DUF2029 domain-containing protein [Chloroflexota bacterium]
MKKIRPDLLFLGLTVFMILMILGITWGNYQFTKENPGGNDFISRWLGTRLFVTEGINPYSDEATLRIQEFFYGREALPNEDQQLFVYPYYSMLFFAPFSLIEDFALARAVWMTVLEIGLLVISFSSMAAVGWKPGRSTLIIFLIFTLTWYHAVRPLINGNPAILAAVFISLAFLMITRNRYTAAGVLIAFSTIKPQMVILLVPFVLWWAISRRKTALIISFSITMFFFVAISQISQPDWLLGNLRQIVAYPSYTEPGTPGGIFSSWWSETGSSIGIGLSIFLALVLLIEWIAATKKDQYWFLWTASLTLVITNLIGIRTSTANYIALMPGLILIFSIIQERWKKESSKIVLFYLITLMVGVWWLFIATLINSDQPWQNPILFFPLPTLLFLNLYWVRYWALNSRKMEIEELAPLKNL